MPEPADVRLSIRAGLVSHRNLHDLEILPGGSEDQIEIAERVEITEASPVGGETTRPNKPKMVRMTRRVRGRQCPSRVAR